MHSLARVCTGHVRARVCVCLSVCVCVCVVYCRPSTPYLQLVMIGSDHNTLHTLKHCFEQLIALSNNNTTPASHNPAAAARVCAAAVRTSLSSLHERLIVSSPSNEASTISVASPDSWVTDATVELSVRGEPLHGVRGSEVSMGTHCAMYVARGAVLLHSHAFDALPHFCWDEAVCLCTCRAQSRAIVGQSKTRRVPRPVALP